MGSGHMVSPSRISPRYSTHVFSNLHLLSLRNKDSSSMVFRISRTIVRCLFVSSVVAIKILSM